ncbi:hypothetical protein M8J75_016594 [Diaphorina citri]|nr:hypothetical protein M8J75_016594 [Diaphorina citri]KAI5754283.1 hypothetical protein M8J77_007429 [Diaphorina citri]
MTTLKWRLPSALGGFLVLALLYTPTASLSRQKRIVGGHPADPPPDANLNDVADTPDAWGVIVDKPVVFVDDDVQSARIFGASEGNKYYAFRGIPYAEPPLNEFRFQRPKRRYLDGDIHAVKNGNPCLQPSPNDPKKVVGDEDCLTLNVYTPKIPTQNDPNPELLPVIFWIHGGGYRRGSGLQYDPNDLVMKNTVVVTVQYRLGSLGFLSSKQKDLPGNVGLLDIASALHWTRHYIQNFGGDPNKITTAGQGSGASAAMLLSLSKLTSSWVQGIVAMSGSALSSFAVDYRPEESYKNVTRKSNVCSDMTGVELVKCLQELSPEEIVRSDTDIESSNIQNGGFVSGLAELLTPGPVVEGEDDEWFLPNLLENSAMDLITSTNKTDKIPMLTGVTKQETGTGVKGGFRMDIVGLLSNTTNFLTDGLPNKLLHANKGLLNNIQLGNALKKLFSNVDYLTGISKSIEAVNSELDKVVQLTTDSLFNLPMFLTSKVWSLTSKTFVYSFEHLPQRSTASHFLTGLPLIRGSDELKKPEISHGEDLIYLFDAKSLDGNSQVHKISNSDDMQIRNMFTSLVAEFARSGTPQLPNSNVKWSPFSAQNSEFLVLSKTPRMDKEFRHCQMALWEGLAEVLQSQKCSLLNLQKLLGTEKGLLGGLTGVNSAGKRVDLLGGLTGGENNLVGGLTGGLTGGNGGLLNLGGKPPQQQGGGNGGLLNLGGQQPPKQQGGNMQRPPVQNQGLLGTGLLGGGLKSAQDQPEGTNNQVGSGNFGNPGPTKPKLLGIL